MHASSFKPLPSCQQTWSHGTNSLATLQVAMEDSSVTAVEADILMGSVVDTTTGSFNHDATTSSLVPIMSHPPIFESDLSAQQFLETVARDPKKQILKLDFKDFDSVAPTIRMLYDNCDDNKQETNDDKDKFVFFNADILPGPGKSIEDVSINADEFVRACLQQASRHYNFAFSLGFKVEVHYPWGHTDAHLKSMKDLVRRHDLAHSNRASPGIVLAINARLLYKNVTPFQQFLNEFPDNTQILVWTGATEPVISSHKVEHIRKCFEQSGHAERVGFDCRVADSVFTGWGWDLIVDLYGVYMLLRKRLLGSTTLPPPAIKEKSN